MPTTPPRARASRGRRPSTSAGGRAGTSPASSRTRRRGRRIARAALPGALRRARARLRRLTHADPSPVTRHGPWSRLPTRTLSSVSSVVGRDAEIAVVEAFLAAHGPTRVLAIVGEPGIGKTTVWDEAVREARERGAIRARRPARGVRGAAVVHRSRRSPGAASRERSWRVCRRRSARHSTSRSCESPPAVRPSGGSSAPRSSPCCVGSPPTPTRRRRGRRPPVARRAVRSGDRVRAQADRGRERCWASSPCARRSVDHSLIVSAARDGTLELLELGPLSVAALHRIVTDSLGRSFPRPTLVRIAQTSGGNPLVRARDRASPRPGRGESRRGRSSGAGQPACR